MGAYAVSKTSLLGLTKVMALELGPRGIRVNCICPGLIETRFGEVVSLRLSWKSISLFHRNISITDFQG